VSRTENSPSDNHFGITIRENITYDTKCHDVEEAIFNGEQMMSSGNSVSLRSQSACQVPHQLGRMEA
jgi:hypothetical protein